MNHAPRSRPILAAAIAALIGLAPAAPARAASLRFHGNGVNDIDRVKIRIDDPATVAPGPPADIGDTDFTIEFWIKGSIGENPAEPQACGSELAWIYGNIVLDRDRYLQDRKFGLSLAAGIPIFGVSPEGVGGASICGAASILDGQWHHLAVQRRAADGWLWMFVDGAEVASEDGPEGALSYPDDGVPGPYCGGPCVNSDPFIVFAAEKHDAGPTYPSFSGWLDEVRFSTVLRYSSSFTRPSSAFMPDAATAALWHFDEGLGDTILDASGAPGGPSNGRREYGGSPAGPEWANDTPFGLTDVPAGSGAQEQTTLLAWPNPARGSVTLLAPGIPASRQPAVLELFDAAGRRVATATGVVSPGGIRFTCAPDGNGGRLARGVYHARLVTGDRTYGRRLVLH
jgi:hypothetical protein